MFACWLNLHPVLGYSYSHSLFGPGPYLIWAVILSIKLCRILYDLSLLPMDHGVSVAIGNNCGCYARSALDKNSAVNFQSRSTFVKVGESKYEIPLRDRKRTLHWAVRSGRSAKGIARFRGSNITEMSRELDLIEYEITSSGRATLRMDSGGRTKQGVRVSWPKSAHYLQLASRLSIAV